MKRTTYGVISAHSRNGHLDIVTTEHPDLGQALGAYRLALYYAALSAEVCDPDDRLVCQFPEEVAA